MAILIHVDRVHESRFQDYVRNSFPDCLGEAPENLLVIQEFIGHIKRANIFSNRIMFTCDDSLGETFCFVVADKRMKDFHRTEYMPHSFYSDRWNINPYYSFCIGDYCYVINGIKLQRIKLFSFYPGVVYNIDPPSLWRK